MTAKIVAIAIFSVALSAIAQLALKIGSSAIANDGLDAGDSTLTWFFKAALANPYIIAGFTLYGIGALSWLLVLSRTELSVAYPFVSLGLVVTMLLGVLVLQESVTVMRLMGASFILLGVILVAQS